MDSEKQNHFAVVDRTDHPHRTCDFVEAPTIKEAIELFCEADRVIHVLEGDRIRIFRVQLGAIEIEPAAWSK